MADRPRGRPSAPPALAPNLGGTQAVAARFAAIPQHRRYLGRRSAPYTLVEYADLQCPFCAAFDRDVLPVVLERYVRPGRLRLELRLVAFIGPDSARAAAAAAAAEQQDRVWQFADLVYHNQRRENSGYVTSLFLGAVAVAVPGLDVPRFAAASGTPGVSDILREDLRSARTTRVDRTPTFELRPTGVRPGSPISAREVLPALAGVVGG